MTKRIKAYLIKIDNLLNANDPNTDWNREKAEHLKQISFFMHERLIHLIVTALFAVLAFMVFIAIMFAFSWGLVILFATLMALLIPYIAHYYLLENSVQKMYEQYDRMVELADKKTGVADNQG